ncbi:MAG TPA: ABC transporter ATP-binding protein [Candidatus Saccharibacteria bacterium]|jgi:ATP-binding cassette subfamily B protein|nr:ABC transporter ATP-binding protein [Candidatus Saccharibacteria bacterium]
MKKLFKLNASKQALWYLFKNNKKVFVPEIILVIAAMLPVTIMTLIPARIAASVFSGNTDGLAIDFVAFFLLGVTHGILWHLADMYWVKYTFPLFYTTGEDVFKYILAKEYPHFIANSPSKIAQYINEFRDNINQIWISIHWGYIGFAMQTPAVILISLKVSWIQALIYVVSVIWLMILLYLKSIKLDEKIDSSYTQDNNLNSAVIDAVTNFVNIKSFKAENKESQAYKKLRLKSEVKFKRAWYAYMRYWFSASKVIRFITWPAILFSSYWLFKTNQIDATQVVLSITVLITLTDFIWGLVDRMANAKKNFSKLQNGYDYLAKEDNIFKHASDFQKDDAIRQPKMQSSLKLNNLNFAYPDRPEELVLENLNLEIKKNEKIGIVGKSGGGKSTLVKLLLGFYDYDPEQVLIDGKPVKKDQLSLINSYVPQDTSLFQQTIKYNIAYAVNGFVSNSEIEDAAKKAHAHEFIIKLKKGYSTLVGERGIKLSLGQRQRIAIARAFLQNKDILILDEATSALDSRTEAKIQESLEKLWSNKTVIAVAHRLSTLNNVDRIVVVDGGKIVEVGTKKELLKLNGKFAELWNQQKDGLI